VSFRADEGTNSLETIGNSFQLKGNSIKVFKTTEEKRRASEIEEEVTRDRQIIHEEVIQKPFESHGNSISISSLKSEVRFRDKMRYRADILRSGERGRELNADVISRSKKEIIDNALEIVCNSLNAQVASIFLISKDGTLERAGIHGFDKSGERVNNDWFAEERYEIGEGFTGKVVGKSGTNPDPGSYGEVHYASYLSNEDIKAEVRKNYVEKFGALGSVMAIPLNGRNRTCGLVRVFNKVDGTAFSEEDISLLLFLTANIASALSNFRREMLIDMLNYISRLLIKPFPSYEEDSLKDVYQRFLDLLVENPETIFKAGILRLQDDSSKSLTIFAKSFAKGVTDNRDNSPRKEDIGEFIWMTALRQKRLIIQDLPPLLQKLRDESKIKFRNEDWIIENGFKSVAGFPLVFKDDSLGTLSLYAAYKYDPDSIDFVQGVVDLLGTFAFNVKNERERRRLEQNIIPKPLQPLPDSQIKAKFKALSEEWKRDTRFLSSITQISTHAAYQQIIGLGWNVLPFIFWELLQNEEPDHWFWALSAITGENPVKAEQQGKLLQMRDAWLKWGEEKNYV